MPTQKPLTIGSDRSASRGISLSEHYPPTRARVGLRPPARRPVDDTRRPTSFDPSNEPSRRSTGDRRPSRDVRWRYARPPYVISLRPGAESTLASFGSRDASYPWYSRPARRCRRPWLPPFAPSNERACGTGNPGRRTGGRGRSRRSRPVPPIDPGSGATRPSSGGARKRDVGSGSTRPTEPWLESRPSTDDTLGGGAVRRTP